MIQSPRHFNFAPLENAVDDLSTAATRYSKVLTKLESDGLNLNASRLVEITRLLMQSGPALTDEAGLPHRPWFKNQIYAPGAYTGYESKPLPGILEALDRKNWSEAESQIPRAARALERETAIVNQFIQLLEDGTEPGSR